MAFVWCVLTPSVTALWRCTAPFVEWARASNSGGEPSSVDGTSHSHAAAGTPSIPNTAPTSSHKYHMEASSSHQVVGGELPAVADISQQKQCFQNPSEPNPRVVGRRVRRGSASPQPGPLERLLSDSPTAAVLFGGVGLRRMGEEGKEGQENMLAALVPSRASPSPVRLATAGPSFSSMQSLPVLRRRGASPGMPPSPNPLDVGQTQTVQSLSLRKRRASTSAAVHSSGSLRNSSSALASNGLLHQPRNTMHSRVSSSGSVSNPTSGRQLGSLASMSSLRRDSLSSETSPMLEASLTNQLQCHLFQRIPSLARVPSGRTGGSGPPSSSEQQLLPRSPSIPTGLEPSQGGSPSPVATMQQRKSSNSLLLSFGSSSRLPTAQQPIAPGSGAAAAMATVLQDFRRSKETVSNQGGESTERPLSPARPSSGHSTLVCTRCVLLVVCFFMRWLSRCPRPLSMSLFLCLVFFHSNLFPALPNSHDACLAAQCSV